MRRTRNDIEKIADAISRKPNAAALLVPRQMAIAVVDEMYPRPIRHGLGVVDEALDIAVDRHFSAREN